MSANRDLRRAVDHYFPQRPEGYFDHAAIGMVPTTVPAAVADCYQMQAGGSTDTSAWDAVVDRARRELAAEFGAEAPDVDFMAHTAEAMSSLAHAVPWQDGDEVLVAAGEYHTVQLSWENLSTPGHHVRVVAVDPFSGDNRTDALIAAIGPRTRVMCVSHVNYSTGTVVDLTALGAACRTAGVLLVVDGSQAAGLLPVYLADVDFYVATSYKWLMAGFGSALVLSRPAAREQLQPPTALRGTAPALRLTFGHVNLAGIFALGAAARVRRDIGPELIRSRVTELVGRLHAEATALGLEPVAALERSAGIVGFGAISDPAAAVTQLSDQGIRANVRGGRLRLSPSFQNTDAELDTLFRALKSLR
ncbi:aminotransferase class V-fold PLP-dependent enzyme [Streptomyces sp. NPDC001530]|uniref:aminotransferase class V-fold PLP-dependent enzyme n=1 Tax=Streptomyces sp. NPDC001530 TaxID=3364582 RepID=UPI0036ACE3CE